MAGRVILGHIEAGSGEENTVKVDDNLKVNGELEVTGTTTYRAGQVIGYTYVRLDAKDSYYCPTSGETEMSSLAMSITPKNANSLLHCQWYIHGEASTHNVGVRVHINGELPSDGYNTVSGLQRYSTLASDLYDGNDDSTPRILTLNYIFLPGSTAEQVIVPACHSTNTTARTYYLNRTVASTGADSYETGVSWGCIWEISQ